MTRLITSGWEENISASNTTAMQGGYEYVSSTNSGTSIDATVRRSGNYSLKCSYQANVTNQPYVVCAYPSPVSGRTYYGRYWVYGDAIQSQGTLPICGMNNAGLRLNSSGNLELWYEGGTPSLRSNTNAPAWPTNQWNLVEYSMLFNSAGNETVTAKLNGTQVYSDSFNYSDITSSFYFVFGSNNDALNPGAQGVNFWIDDIALNDNQGASQNSWPDANGRIWKLIPTGDNTVTNWTGGAGGTTNLYQAVDNNPPVGLAVASETNLSQIKCISSTGTATYIATMQSLEAAGATAGATCTVFCIDVQNGGATTATKSGTVETTSNPVLGTKALGFRSGFAMGTWPTQWAFTRGYDYAPTINTASATLMKVVKTDTTTGEANICMLAATVEVLDPAIEDPAPISVYMLGSYL